MVFIEHSKIVHFVHVSAKQVSIQCLWLYLKSDEVTLHTLAHSALEDQLVRDQVWVDGFGCVPEGILHQSQALLPTSLYSTQSQLQGFQPLPNLLCFG